MRILLVHPSADFSTADVAVGIRAGLVAEGHEVLDYRLNRRLTALEAAMKSMYNGDREMDLSELALWAGEGIPFKAIVEGCSWVLFINGMGLHPGALIALRSIGVRVAGWFTEAPYETVAGKELGLAEYCDVAFVNERTVLAQFQAVLDEAGPGRIAVSLPHAYNPDLHHPYPPPEPEHWSDVLLIGTGFAERQILLEQVDWTGIDLRLGGLWPMLEEPNELVRYRRYGCLPNRQSVQLYAGTKILLNPHRRPVGHAESANPRTFEAAACGVFQLADERQEIRDLFGEAIPTWRPGVPWQLSALIRRYLADEPERRRLADLARQRVQGQTFTARAHTIVETLEACERGQTRSKLVAIPA